ncbi:uncharacterized protein BT62DRAFT_956759 [Guyanagaster necrorhizus]|uniref:C2H2-type domain-containing protein n=1 Tax=Guyanagaster necrorhizus TaxID=856835 RepID=A0A9P7VHY3_9AGAR|nr:uncharacterized protein BT62DRAFT_956759 [Guyanagaster necrorhizus MCA 3950]KAG7440700.1 hypothetical protein BT62DRAFT_956759 [Guyanagaster necrorhizus MCA 3950]
MAPANISLPSIQEMFPEYLLHIPPERRVESSAPQSPTPFHSRPSALSNGRHSHERHSPGFFRSVPAYHSSLPYKLRVSDAPVGPSRHSASEDIEDDTKRFICTICNKRFGRPSGLKIHFNTHTGATPFRCPVIRCRKEFNVNSNMLRHYRNHMNPTSVTGVSALSHSPPISHYQRTPKSNSVLRSTLSSPSFEKDEQGQLRSQPHNAVSSREKHDGRYMEGPPSMYEHEGQYGMSDIRSRPDTDTYGWQRELGGGYLYATPHSQPYV